MTVAGVVRELVGDLVGGSEDRPVPAEFVMMDRDSH